MGKEGREENLLQRKIPKTKYKQTSKHQKLNSSTPDAGSRKTENTDFLFISLVPWSYKQAWQKPLVTQTTAYWCPVWGKGLTRTAQWCDAAGHCWFTISLLLLELYTDSPYPATRQPAPC